MNERARRIPARIGVTALNLLAPGLGLLRVQRLRPALILLFAPVIAMMLLFLAQSFLDRLEFVQWIVLLTFLLIVAIGAYIASGILTWRASKRNSSAGPWWSRWHGILGALILVTLLIDLSSDLARSRYRNFYLPTDNMAPLLEKGDKIVASMRAPREVHRGMIVLLDTPNGTYIKRIAALPGDRIAIRNGIIILNGKAVPQTFIEEEKIKDFGSPVSARKLAEKFPGEEKPHEIYDIEDSYIDNMPEQRIATGRIFVLGDNRDRSTDSRVPVEEAGLEQVPISSIRGVPQFFYWAKDRMKIGTRLSD